MKLCCPLSSLYFQAHNVCHPHFLSLCLELVRTSFTDCVCTVTSKRWLEWTWAENSGKHKPLGLALIRSWGYHMCSASFFYTLLRLYMGGHSAMSHALPYSTNTTIDAFWYSFVFYRLDILQREKVWRLVFNLYFFFFLIPIQCSEFLSIPCWPPAGDRPSLPFVYYLCSTAHPLNLPDLNLLRLSSLLCRWLWDWQKRGQGNWPQLDNTHTCMISVNEL